MAPVLLTLGPLAAYLALQGVWSCLPRPRVVSGAVDYLLLAVALGTILAFGPVSGVLLGAIFPEPGTYARLAWLCFLTTAALLLAAPSHRRLIVYNVGPDRLEAALRDVVAGLPVEFKATLNGFVDRDGGHALTANANRRFRWVEIEAHGRRAEDLIGRIAGPLNDRLAHAEGRPSWWLGAFWIALATASILIPAIDRTNRGSAIDHAPPPEGHRSDPDADGPN